MESIYFQIAIENHKCLNNTYGGDAMSDNWIVQNLQNALDTWNEKLAEIWSIITQSPQEFRGGEQYVQSAWHCSCCFLLSE